jgi:PleD family two-component response regulator
LREELASLPHAADSGRFHVTVSVGLTLVDPDVSVEQSIDRAALYVAKASGRDRTVIWDASMNTSPARPQGRA